MSSDNISLNNPELDSKLNNYIFPEPLLNKQFKRFDKAGYKNRVLEDDLIKDVKSLIEYGNSVFENCNDIVDLSNIESIKGGNLSSVVPANFVQINEIAERFYLTFKPHNGLSSMRRGFYKLLPIPSKVSVLDLRTWKTQVLFNEGPTNNITYKYDCHVGPLVNRYAICRNLSVKEFVKLPDKDSEQKDFLQKLQSITIYVSSAEMIKEKSLKYPMKEVLWFLW